MAASKIGDLDQALVRFREAAVHGRENDSYTEGRIEFEPLKEYQERQTIQMTITMNQEKSERFTFSVRSITMLFFAENRQSIAV